MDNEVKGTTEEAGVEEMGEKPPPIKLETCEDWQNFFKMLAEPNCKKCLGQGYVGINTTTKMPVGCSAKRCSMSKLRQHQRTERIRKMKEKQREAKLEVKDAPVNT